MLDFAALWVSKGIAGFMRAREGASKGGVGFIWARKSSPAALCDRESAKKFALRAENTPNLVYLCLLGELFRGKAGGWAMLGEFFRACWRSGRVCAPPRMGANTTVTNEYRCEAS